MGRSMLDFQLEARVIETFTIGFITVLFASIIFNIKYVLFPSHCKFILYIYRYHYGIQ